MKEVLKSLFTGYSFRSKVENEEGSDLAVIQMKDLDNGYQEIGEDLICINSSKVPEKYLLQSGDVLFISKGANNYALVFRKEIKAVAAAAFFVLRPDESKVIPEYLAWYINQRDAQRFIEENRAGTYIPNVNKTTLMDLKVKAPPLDKQERIAKVAELSRKEQAIYAELKQNRKIMVDTMLQSTII